MQNLNEQPTKMKKKNWTNRVGESITNLWCNISFKRFEIKTFPYVCVHKREKNRAQMAPKITVAD